MALVEVALKKPQFGALLKLIVTAAPIPVPTFLALGSDRLVSDMQWGDVALANTLAGVIAPPGMLLAQAPVTVWHVSIAELRANPGALGSSTPATAWLLVSAEPGRVRVDLAGIAFPNRAPDIYPAPVPLGITALSLPSQVKVVGAALVSGDQCIMTRFGTRLADNLLSVVADPPMEGGNWRIRVSGEFFADFVRDALNSGVAKSPGGTLIEEPPSAAWAYIPFVERWGVVGGVGLEKVDACPGLFGDVDISVNVGAVLLLDPSASDGTLGLNLRISTDASDWDSFRCWAGSGGLGGVVLAALIHPFVGIGVAIGSGIAVGEIIRLGAGDALDDVSVGNEMKQVSGDDTSVTFEGKVDLPALPQTVLTADAGPEGLVVTGTILLASASHTRSFTPNGGTLGGVWHGHFSCKENRWRQDFVIPSIRIADGANVLGKALPTVPVRVFHTSAVEPVGQWALDVLTTIEPVQYVEMKAIAPVPGNSGRLYLHTSAGIRRFEVAPLPTAPAIPNDLTLSVERVNCRLFTEVFSELTKLHWLVDPPELDRGMPIIRQWLLTFERVAVGSTIVVHPRGPEGMIAAGRRIDAPESGEVALEYLTAADTELDLEMRLSEGSTGVRLMQRWLQPTKMVDLGAPAIALARNGSTILALNGERLIQIDRESNQMITLPSRQHGLFVSGGRTLLWGQDGIEEVEGNYLRQVSAYPIKAAINSHQVDSILAGNSEMVELDGRARAQYEPAMQSRHLVPPFSIRLSSTQIVAAWRDQLVFATPLLADIRTDRIDAEMPTTRGK
ncbi:hypothetical protein [Mesorhizobium sp. M0500]|uniref:hypothetical protein n=1 Tax=Mesorhizobium sp. M0500 TaxID=2956953 RepID=UPI00333B9898